MTSSVHQKFCFVCIGALLSLLLIQCENNLETYTSPTPNQIQVNPSDYQWLAAENDSSNKTSITIIENPFRDYCYIYVNGLTGIQKLEIYISDKNGIISKHQHQMVNGRATLKVDFSDFKQDGVFICDIIADQKIWRYDLIKTSDN